MKQPETFCEKFVTEPQPGTYVLTATLKHGVVIAPQMSKLSGLTVADGQVQVLWDDGYEGFPEWETLYDPTKPVPLERLAVPADHIRDRALVRAGATADALGDEYVDAIIAAVNRKLTEHR